MTFIPNPLGLPEVNHINGDKSDASVYNLEWRTRAQNNAHAINTGLKPPVLGSRNGQAKLTESSVVEIRKMLNSGMRLREIGEKFSMSDSAISAIRTGRRWSQVA